MDGSTAVPRRWQSGCESGSRPTGREAWAAFEELALRQAEQPVDTTIAHRRQAPVRKRTASADDANCILATPGISEPVGCIEFLFRVNAPFAETGYADSTDQRRRHLRARPAGASQGTARTRQRHG